MGPYSHFILAARLAEQLRPDPCGDYYWGAVIPDIRYLAKMPRSHTHLGDEQLKQLRLRHPDLSAFLLGYQVHCLIDQIDLVSLIGSAFPFNFLRHLLPKKISQPQLALLVEMYFLQTPAIPPAFASSHNEILQDLGLTPQQSAIFGQALQEYLDAHSIEAALKTFLKIGMLENARLDQYFSAYQAMEKRRALKSLLIFSIKNARVDQFTLNYVQSHISQ